MWRIVATSLLLSAIAGCAVEVSEQAAPGDEGGADVQVDGPADRSPPPPPAYSDDTDDLGSSNPCAVEIGVTYVLDGQLVFAPAICNEGWIDKGDPPPEPQQDHDDWS